MAPIKVFTLGATGYVGSTTIDLLLKKGTAAAPTANRFSFRALVRSQAKADAVRPLGIEPVFGTLEDHALLEAEAAKADVVLSFADSGHLSSIQAILRGLAQRPRLSKHGRKRPILIHTNGTGVIMDDTYGMAAGQDVFSDDDSARLSSLSVDQFGRKLDLEIMSPKLKGVVDTYVVLPPTIWGYGTGAGNPSSIQIPLMVERSLQFKQALQVGEGKNLWSRVHVLDLAQFYVLLLERALAEPELGADKSRDPLPKNKDGYYFVQSGVDFSFGSVAQEIANAFVNLGINPSGTVKSTMKEEENVFWPEGWATWLATNSRSRAVKAREILGWDAKYDDFYGHVRDEVQRQLKDREKEH